jgi:hypothetical protein
MGRHWSRRVGLSFGALALVVAALLVVLPRFPRRRAPDEGAPVAGRANAAEPRHLGDFGRLPGTPFLMANINSGSGGYSSMSKLSSGGARSIHNYVFLNINDQSVRRLLPTNDALIVSTERISEGGDVRLDYETRDEHATTVRWLLYWVVKVDSDHDGDLDEDDLRTLAVSDAGGKGYAELVGDVRHVYGQTMRDPETLVVVHDGGGRPVVSVIDLPHRVVTSTTPLPDLGQDVRP